MGEGAACTQGGTRPEALQSGVKTARGTLRQKKMSCYFYYKIKADGNECEH